MDLDLTTSEPCREKMHTVPGKNVGQPFGGAEIFLCVGISIPIFSLLWEYYIHMSFLFIFFFSKNTFFMARGLAIVEIEALQKKWRALPAASCSNYLDSLECNQMKPQFKILTPVLAGISLVKNFEKWLVSIFRKFVVWHLENINDAYCTFKESVPFFIF